MKCFFCYAKLLLSVVLAVHSLEHDSHRTSKNTRFFGIACD
jgi:hypothetical protein